MTWTSRHLQMSLFLLTLPFTRIGCFGRTRDPSIPWTERRSFCGLCTNTPHRRGSSVMCLLGHARHTHEGAVPAGPGRLHPLCDNSTSPSRWSLSEPVTDWIGKRWKTSASACNGSGRMEEVGGSNSVISFHSFSHLAQSLFSILVRRVVTKIALFVSSTGSQTWHITAVRFCRARSSYARAQKGTKQSCNRTSSTTQLEPRTASSGGQAANVALRLPLLLRASSSPC
ncbi:hypothetical protein HDK77DRAFT_178355 [Phyllosticta capitalensis]